MNKPTAIIIGASSGIGRALAKILAENNYSLGLAARRIDLLRELKKELPPGTCIKKIDVSKFADAERKLMELIDETGGADLIVITAGIGYDNPDLKWELEKETIDVNAAGFALMAGMTIKYFRKKKSGHLAAVSSIAALRGNGTAPAYFASKAFMSNYLQGLRHNVIQSGLKIYITDILPGFVDTDMASGNNQFWMAPPEKAARQIYRAIKKRKKRVYVTKRWRLIAWLIRMMPDWIYNRI